MQKKPTDRPEPNQQCVQQDEADDMDGDVCERGKNNYLHVYQYWVVGKTYQTDNDICSYIVAYVR